MTVEELTEALLVLQRRVDDLERRAEPAEGEVDLGLIDRLQKRDGPAYVVDDARGAITLAGATRFGERPAVWHVERGVPELLGVDDSLYVSVLSALGHPARLQIVRALLRQPMAAAALTEAVALGSTGRLYHHLKELVAAGVVVQRKRGIYEIPGRNVVPILGLLACSLDLSASAPE